VIRHDWHATREQLAALAAGALSRRKTARISAHLTGCDQCGQVSRQVHGVPAILASAEYPPMPASVSIRIEAALRVEATQRLAAMPATEGGRGDLPARHRRQAGRRGWRLPGFSVPTTRLVAAAGALAIVAVGGYVIASHTGNGVTAPSSAGSAASLPQAMSLGPQITYGGAGAQHTIHAVQQSTDFVPDHLAAQASAAVKAARASESSTAQPPSGAPGASRAQGSTSEGIATSSPGTAGRLSACINLIAPGRVLLLVDLAHYEEQPATIIVTARMGSSPPEAWVVGSSCSAIDRDVLAHVVLGGL
jgi:hypothetical protein